MAKTRSVMVRLAGANALSAIASPVRMEIIGTLQTHGPGSIRELATHLARPADGLYHHVRLLRRAGVLREESHRKVGRREEAVYALTTPRIAGTLDPASPASKEGVIRAASAALRLAAREFASAIEAGEGLTVGACPSIRASRQRVWLTPEGLERLRRHLARLERFLSAQTKKRQGRLFAVTTVVVPLVKKRRV
jgi:hypothetical protein